MAAISSTLLGLLDAGSHVVLQRAHYGGTSYFVTDVLSRFGIEHTRVDQADPSAFARAMRPTTRVVIVETPGNPTLALTDLAAVAEIAHRGGALLLVDNTFATPVNQRPLEHGADLVMHSATKFLGGHSDLTAGAIAGRRDLVDTVWRITRSLGATLGAFDAWLLARGMRTLALRVGRQNESALAIATFLSQHQSVTEVNFPGLPGHAQYALARRQMRGFGAIMSIRLVGGLGAAERMLDRLQLFVRAASVGGVESLAVRPAAMLATILKKGGKADGEVDDDLVRLSIGVEALADLQRDLAQALAPD
jgi:methionine-gamma-lyase